MATQELIVSNGKATAELLRQEKRVRDAERNYAEAWVAVGDAIRELYEGGEWRRSGYRNFDQYMNERGRDAIGCAKSHAQALMAAARVRHLLPDMPTSPPERGSQVWPIKVVTQFTRQFRNPNTGKVVTLRESTIKSIGNKCVELAAKGEPVTVATVKPLVDKALGVTRIAEEQKDKELALAPTPDEALETLRRELAGTLRGFKNNPALVSEAKECNPEVVRRLAGLLEDFARFLKEF